MCCIMCVLLVCVLASWHVQPCVVEYPKGYLVGELQGSLYGEVPPCVVGKPAWLLECACSTKRTVLIGVLMLQI